MIKVDIVNEVSKIADITKVKAEVAVDAVFEAMRISSMLILRARISFRLRASSSRLRAPSRRRECWAFNPAPTRG